MNPPPSSASGPVVKKPGIPVLGWIGIGCGGIALLVIISLVLIGGFFAKKVKNFAANPSKGAAEMMLMANKDMEKVSENEKSGEMTVRVKSTGEEITLKYDDLAKGQFTIKDKDGKTTQLGQADLTKIPAWVPRYPGATGENSALQTEDATQTAGMLTFTTTDTTEACEKFYADAAAKLALTSSSRSAMTIEGSNTLSLHYAADKRELTLTVFGKPGEPLTVQEIYTEKK